MASRKRAESEPVNGWNLLHPPQRVDGFYKTYFLVASLGFVKSPTTVRDAGYVFAWGNLYKSVFESASLIRCIWFISAVLVAPSGGGETQVMYLLDIPHTCSVGFARQARGPKQLRVCLFKAIYRSAFDLPHAKGVTPVGRTLPFVWGYWEYCLFEAIYRKEVVFIKKENYALIL